MADISVATEIANKAAKVAKTNATNYANVAVDYLETVITEKNRADDAFFEAVCTSDSSNDIKIAQNAARNASELVNIIKKCMELATAAISPSSFNEEENKAFILLENGC